MDSNASNFVKMCATNMYFYEFEYNSRALPITLLENYA